VQTTLPLAVLNLAFEGVLSLAKGTHAAPQQQTSVAAGHSLFPAPCISHRDGLKASPLMVAVFCCSLCAAHAALWAMTGALPSRVVAVSAGPLLAQWNARPV
jgi:hypothetical protein